MCHYAGFYGVLCCWVLYLLVLYVLWCAAVVCCCGVLGLYLFLSIGGGVGLCYTSFAIPLLGGVVYR